MNSSFAHKIIKDRRLVVQCFKGSLDLQVAIAGKMAQMADPDYDRTFNSILDLSNTDAKFSKEDIEKFINYLQKEGDSNPERRTAMITKTPNQAAHYSLFQYFSEGQSARYVVVSTIESATEWVGESPSLVPLITETIEEIKASL